MNQTWLWIVFNIFVLGMLAVDLGVFNRQAHIISLKEAARWTVVVVIAVALATLWGLGRADLGRWRRFIQRSSGQ